MRQGKFIRCLWILLAVLCLAGCGRKDNEEAEEEPETVLSAAVQYTLSHLAENGNGSMLLGDALYYSDRISEDGGGEWIEAIYRKTGEQEADKLAEFPWPKQRLIHYLADQDGAVYSLYIEAEETEGGAADYKVYLKKDGAEGDVEYCTLADEEEASIPEGGVLWDAFPERLWKWFGVNDGVVDEQGRICLYSRYNLLLLFDSSGSLVCGQELQPGESNSDTGVVDAGVHGCYFYQVGGEEASIQEIDMRTGELSPKEELPFRPEEIASILNGYDEGIFVNTDKSLYRFTPSGGAERLLDWEDFFLRGYNVLQACIDGDGFQLFIRDHNSILRQMRIDAAAPEESRKQKVSIGVFSVMAKGTIGELVAAFNAASPDYQVEIVEYEYNPADDFNEVYRQLLKGEGPDMFELRGLRLPVDVLADKGALEDLGPYLERSEIIRMEDILPCVIEAGSHQGRLVGLCPLFSIEALAVVQGYAEGCGWTPEEFLAYAAEHPDGALYKNGTTYCTLLEDLMMGDMGEYIDWEKRECSFNTEGFIGLLETVRQANVSAADIEGEKGREGFLAGRYLAVKYGISSPEYYADAMDYMEGYGEVVGYPASSGEPYFLMEPQNFFSINSKSGCKEGAWAFLEYVMSVDFRNWEGTQMGAWPARIDAFEDSLVNTMESRWGNNIGRRTQHFSGETLENSPCPEITEEIKEFLRFMVENAHYEDRTAMIAEYKYIISEEAEAYFAGDKTAREAAELIQNRVSLFLSE